MSTSVLNAPARTPHQILVPPSWRVRLAKTGIVAVIALVWLLVLILMLPRGAVGGPLLRSASATPSVPAGFQTGEAYVKRVMTASQPFDAARTRADAHESFPGSRA